MPLRNVRPLETALPDGWEVFANLGVAALLVDRAATVLRANIAAEELLGQSEAALGSRPLARPLAALLEHEAGVRAHDLSLETAAGPVQADVAVTPLAGRPGWLTLVILPRTEAARPAPPKAAATVAAMLAHEIKNPLAGIRGAAQLLEDGMDPDSRELTALIRSEVDRITRLVGRLEGLTDERVRAPEPVNLNELMHHVASLAGNSAPGILIREDYDPSLPPIEGERDALVQLFLNLAKNAVEALGSHGQITFATFFRYGARAAGRSLPIEARIEDNGPGLDPAVAGRLFDPFVSSKAAGRGLGLTLVAKIAADHGAVVEHARVSDRTIFRLRFAPAPRKS